MQRCRRCGIACSERVPPSPLGWYFGLVPHSISIDVLSKNSWMVKVNPLFKIYNRFTFRHFVKGINKRLFKSFNLVSCPNLKLWQRSLNNMIWWAISSSIGKIFYLQLLLYFLFCNSRQCSSGERKDSLYFSPLFQCS